jgi:predicted negative regulator of RcsB-dependent stress response
VADKDDKKTGDAPASKATPTFDPKPVNVGGESLIDRVYPYRKKIGMFVLLGFGVWAVIAVVIHFRDTGREKKTDKLAAVIDVGDRKVVDPAMPPDPNVPAAIKDKDPTFPNAQARANGILDALAKQGTTAAGPTYKASVLVEAGKLDEAIAEYKKSEHTKGIEGILAREGLGLAQEMKATAEKDSAAQQKGLEEALATFAAMQPDDKGPRHAYALYHQARILVQLNKIADAKAMFEKAKEAAKDVAELAPLIDQRLATLGT